MRRHCFSIIVYSLLTMICLGYAFLGFVDMDLSRIVWSFDPFKFIMGLGTAILCIHTIFRFVSSDR